jgi:putative spermidine/putrescine transport system ATP-binding protein
MIRPHRISLTRDGEGALHAGATNTAPGLVTRTSYVGDVVQYEVEIDGATLKVETRTRHGDIKPAPGETLRCEWKAQDMRVLQDASS